MNQLHAEDTLHFGQYKGKMVKDVFARDPGYFAWLRENVGKCDLDAELNKAIDLAISQSKSLRKRFKLSKDLQPVGDSKTAFELGDSLAIAPSKPTAAYVEWGAW